MESFLNRYRNITVLVLTILAQLVLLSLQVKNDRNVGFIRSWTVTAVSPLGRRSSTPVFGAVAIVLKRESLWVLLKIFRLPPLPRMSQPLLQCSGSWIIQLPGKKLGAVVRDGGRYMSSNGVDRGKAHPTNGGLPEK